MLKMLKKVNKVLRVVFIGFIAIYAIVKIFDVAPKQRIEKRKSFTEPVTSEFDEIW